jgi:hypothetical protein
MRVPEAVKEDGRSPKNVVRKQKRIFSIWCCEVHYDPLRKAATKQRRRGRSFGSGETASPPGRVHRMAGTASPWYKPDSELSLGAQWAIRHGKVHVGRVPASHFARPASFPAQETEIFQVYRANSEERIKFWGANRA